PTTEETPLPRCHPVLRIEGSKSNAARQYLPKRIAGTRGGFVFLPEIPRRDQIACLVEPPSTPLARKQESLRDIASELLLRLAKIACQVIQVAVVAMLHALLDLLFNMLFGHAIAVTLRCVFAVGFAAIYAHGIWEMIFTICPNAGMAVKRGYHGTMRVFLALTKTLAEF